MDLYDDTPGCYAHNHSSLSTKVPTETLAEDLKSVFTRFGACHVKIKQDKKKGLPGAFVQFEVSFHSEAFSFVPVLFV
jgi:hypothetical protein